MDKSPSELLSLPSELIHLISTFLPFEYAACLTLCNRDIYQILSPFVLLSPKTISKEQRAIFLNTLSKDLSHHYCCHICAKLHPSNSVQPPRTVPQTRSCPQTRDHPFHHGNCTVLPLTFSHIQLAMKPHHYGATHLGLPMSAFTATQALEEDFTDFDSLFSTSTLIVANELYMRSQQWLLTRLKHSREYIPNTFFNHFCTHIWIGSGIMGPENLSTIMGGRLEQLGSEGATQQCVKCPMDYLIDIHDLGISNRHTHVAMCVTRWYNLGSGIAPWEGDAKWQSHLGADVPQYKPHVLGSIRQAFESHTTLPLQEFSTINRQNLSSRKDYRPFTYKADGDVWRWLPGYPNRWYLESADDCEKQAWWGLARMRESRESMRLRAKRQRNMLDPRKERSLSLSLALALFIRFA